MLGFGRGVGWTGRRRYRHVSTPIVCIRTLGNGGQRHGWRSGSLTTISTSAARRLWRRGGCDGRGGSWTISTRPLSMVGLLPWRRSSLWMRASWPRLPGLGRGRGSWAGNLGITDLEMLGLATEGLALVTEGKLKEGMWRLDEAAAAALGGEFEGFVGVGWTCCYLIYACERVRDYDRAPSGAATWRSLPNACASSS
jgi:hypothetical protein